MPAIYKASDEHPPRRLQPLWLSPSSTTGTVLCQCYADTGCQSCLAGLKVVKKLSVSIEDLIPVTIKMQTANNDNIHIMGATILRLSGKSRKGEERFTY